MPAAEVRTKISLQKPNNNEIVWAIMNYSIQTNGRINEIRPLTKVFHFRRPTFQKWRKLAVK